MPYVRREFLRLTGAGVAGLASASLLGPTAFGDTHTGWNGETWGANQRISVDEALQVNTINGVYNSHEEVIDPMPFTVDFRRRIAQILDCSVDSPRSTSIEPRRVTPGA
jgi:hypothetical protein